ncbi:hypothetical protein QR98_0098420 [Sarcoptes scabiei]|uniref:Uncharacterized protein n=1 Tax=Sarcoptes scabiei TaxID=52283 RepID=A0A132AJU6_SARSC|nr:hypothetical protein QR98_0098420 [Sarcoptes scabiei]
MALERLPFRNSKGNEFFHGSKLFPMFCIIQFNMVGPNKTAEKQKNSKPTDLHWPMYGDDYEELD